MKKIGNIGRIGFFVLATCAAICGCGSGSPKESDEDLVQDKLTNDVVGYSRTIAIEHYIFGDLNHYEEDWQNTNDFEGYRATVEFVNSIGGIERTNLAYRIFDFNFTNRADGSVKRVRAATLDPVIAAEREADQYRTFINAIEGQTNRP